MMALSRRDVQVILLHVRLYYERITFVGEDGTVIRVVRLPGEYVVQGGRGWKFWQRPLHLSLDETIDYLFQHEVREHTV